MTKKLVSTIITLATVVAIYTFSTIAPTNCDGIIVFRGVEKNRTYKVHEILPHGWETIEGTKVVYDVDGNEIIPAPSFTFSVCR